MQSQRERGSIDRYPTCRNAGSMAARTKTIKLEGRALRAERRVSMVAFGSDDDRQIWRTSNDQVKRLAEREPNWTAERLVDHILRHPDPNAYGRAKGIAADLASRFAGTPGDILLEQAEFWTGYQELPYSNKWINFALLYFGRGIDLETAADLSGLAMDSARILAFRVNGHYSYRRVARAAGVGRSKARVHWLQFLEAIRETPCYCGLPVCSMSKRGSRKRVVKQIKIDYDTYRKPGVSGSPSEKAGKGMAGGDPTGAYTPYPHRYTYSVVKGLKILDHRLTWIREHGGIPSEHDIHHVDGNPRNNAKGNLAMVPRWLHRIIH